MSCFQEDKSPDLVTMNCGNVRQQWVEALQNCKRAEEDGKAGRNSKEMADSDLKIILRA